MTRPPTPRESLMMFVFGMLAARVAQRAVRPPRPAVDLHGQPIARIG